MHIGPHAISPNLILAPMAGVTDKPFRILCKKMGAGLCVSEMTISDPRFWRTSKSVHRMDHSDEPSPIAVQIAGTDPAQLAEAARFNVEHGAQIIDINMGCPAKKVTQGYSGSALMKTPDHALSLIEAVVGAVSVPVTLKTRLGWDDNCLNAADIARRAEAVGITMITIHGRTRCQFYKGRANWSAISEVKEEEIADEQAKENDAEPDSEGGATGDAASETGDAERNYEAGEGTEAAKAAAGGGGGASGLRPPRVAGEAPGGRRFDRSSPSPGPRAGEGGAEGDG